MAEPLAPGSTVEGCTVEQVLTWSPRGGVYRVRTPVGPRLLKEILYPPELTTDQRAERCELLSQTVATWQALKHPLATPVAWLALHHDRCYLLLPELNGSRLSIQARLRSQPPSADHSLRWADQLAGLVEELQQSQNPLAYEFLHPDRILADSEGKLSVFNPGWTEILWQDPQQLSQRSIQHGLKLYGQLLVSITTGYADHPASASDLPQSLIWPVSRCLTTLSGSQYHSFAEVRQALRNLAVQGDEARNLRPLGSLPPVFGFMIPVLAPLGRNPRRTVAGIALLLLTVALVWLWLAWLQPPLPPRPALALAIHNQVYLYSDEAGLRRQWRFPKAIRSMLASGDGARLFVGLQGDSSLWVLRTDNDERHSLDFPEILDQLHLSSDGKELLLVFVNGRLLRLDLSKQQEVTVQWVKTSPGIAAALAIPLCQPADHPPRQPTNQGILTVHPEVGLSLYDASSSRLIRSWSAMGVTSAILLDDGKVLSATPDPTIYALNSSLAEISNQKMPGKSGPVRLLIGPQRNAFWSLQGESPDQGLVAFWRSLEEGCLEQASLSLAPICATVDYRGRLWVVTERRQLFLVEQGPLRVTQKTTLAGTVRAMTFLSPNNEPRGLDRMLNPAKPPGP